MIFDGRPIDAIADSDFERLVSDHVSERQHLEYKLTFDNRNDDDRLEILCDIASLANAGGGYLIFGIRDDGKGRAQRFDASMLSDPARLRQSLAALCTDHIAERIDGLTIQQRTIATHPIVVVRVPFSTRRPHMVTFLRGTHFRTRISDGKREMSIGEVRAAFMDDVSSRRLDRIEEAIAKLGSESEKQAQRRALAELEGTGVRRGLGRVEDGELLATQARTRFEGDVGTQATFWIAATPLNPRRESIDVDDAGIDRLLRDPPGSRRSGWNMEEPTFRNERIPDGLRRGEKEWEYLELLANGHMEFWAPLGEHFCWGQSTEEFQRAPTLYPWAVTEYPTTFLRLYRAVVDLSGLSGEIVIQLELRNLRGYRLRPYRPGTYGYILRDGTGAYGDQHYFDDVHVPSDFPPDDTSFRLLKGLYGAFGHRAEHIPFYRPDAGFDFGS